jgi:RNA polymerase sigma factor for flagellar operon FliA
MCVPFLTRLQKASPQETQWTRRVFKMTHSDKSTLIQENLPLIRNIAHRLGAKLPSNIEIHDLVNTGVLGLLDAVEKFEPSRGVKFKTYAEVRIRGAMLDSLRELDWAPRSLRKKSKDLERMHVELAQRLGRAATDEELSEAMGEDLRSFHALIDQLHGLNLGSFETPDREDETENYLNHYPDDGSTNPFSKYEAKEATKTLGAVIDGLPERERLVLSLYYYEEFTMKEIGTLLGVNESRISQLHTKAMQRLRSQMEEPNTKVKVAAKAAGFR